jgi:hypothetical protein
MPFQAIRTGLTAVRLVDEDSRNTVSLAFVLDHSPDLTAWHLMYLLVGFRAIVNILAYIPHVAYGCGANIV